MACLEGMGRRIVCAKAESQLQRILARKRQVLAKNCTNDQIKYEMTRDLAPRQQAAKLAFCAPLCCSCPPSVLLVSMTPSVRALSAVQLGLSPLSQPYFGDPHEEAWQIPSQKERWLHASGVAGQSKLNPFASPQDWVGCLNHMRVARFVLSYMSWGDMFSTAKTDHDEAQHERAGAIGKSPQISSARK
jgi:hypothetical protein